MKKYILFAILILTIRTAAGQTADKPTALKAHFGTNHYDGDLGNEITEFSGNDYLYGAGVAFYLNKYFDAAVEGQYFQLDFYRKPYGQTTGRDRFFETDVLNLSSMVRFKPLGNKNPVVDPYIAGGIGVNHLGNEDNIRVDDDEFMFSVPFGVGVNANLTDLIAINAQVIYNLTWVDDKIDHYPLQQSKVKKEFRDNNYSAIDSQSGDGFLTPSIGLVLKFGSNEQEPIIYNDNRIYQRIFIAKLDRPTDKAIRQLDSPPEVKKDVRYKMLQIVNNVQFEFDRADIIEPALDELKSLAVILHTYPELSVSVEGYADERGSNEYNINLSQRRADAVKSYFESKGIGSNRISTSAFGEDQALMGESSDIETTHSQNRSVRITLEHTGN